MELFSPAANPLTAEDVVYTIQRVVNLPKDPAAWLITQMGIDDKDVLTAVKAPDPYTVVISSSKPFSPGAFLSIMANPVARVVDSKTVKTHVVNNDWAASGSATTRRAAARTCSSSGSAR